MKPADFIAKILPAAQASHAATGIPASFTIAQAALESAWGEKAPGNNLFGIKANKAWTGAVTEFATHEVINGQRIAITDKFRAYPSWRESINDHADFFRKNPRYAACFKEISGAGWARAVAAAGYATDPSYAKLIISIIGGRNLQQYDTPAQ
jgi:flagellum-specific peptidoglycan hydrolase FlgJ